MDHPDKMISWQIAPSGAGFKFDEIFPGSLELVTMPLPELGSKEVLVEIKGCSICRRDRDPVRDGVDRRDIPERIFPETVQFPACDISGRVVAGQAAWVGREVVVASSELGHSHGLSSHVPVSVHHLIEIKNRSPFLPLAHLSVAIDALAVPFQAAVRAGMGPGAKVIVWGLGGEGPFWAQTVKALGAATVMVVDASEERLSLIRKHGADLLVNTRDKTTEDIIAEVTQIKAQSEQGGEGWTVFGSSRCGVDVSAILALVNRADTITMVRPSADERENMLNKLSAVDVAVIDGRGCPSEDYPGLVEWAAMGTVALSPFLLSRPMSWVKQVLSSVNETASSRRIVFTTDDFGIEASLEARSCR